MRLLCWFALAAYLLLIVVSICANIIIGSTPTVFLQERTHYCMNSLDFILKLVGAGLTLKIFTQLFCEVIIGVNIIPIILEHSNYL
jgi:type III secretory pathway component EscS